MKTLLFILAVLFGVMPMLYARFKRIVAESGDTQYSDEPEDYDGGMAEDSFFNFGETEVEESPVQQPYFTYETPGADFATTVSKREAPAAMEEPAATPQFDLRQAVIYQTLLNNRYNYLDN